MAMTRFNFINASGHDLSGRLEGPDIDPIGWAIFAHCFTCGKDSAAAVKICRSLAARGIGVLRFDFSGLGQSGGDFGSAGFDGNVGDLLDAAKAMRTAGRVVSILIGHSLGGAAVMAAAPHLPDIKGVVTIGAPFRPEHVLTHIERAILDQLTESERRDVAIGGRKFSISSGFVDSLRNSDPTAYIASLRKPLLVMHSPTDNAVGIENASHIFEAARHPKSFVSLDNTDHMLEKARDCGFVADLIVAWSTRYVGEADPSRTIDMSVASQPS